MLPPAVHIRLAACETAGERLALLRDYIDRYTYRRDHFSPETYATQQILNFQRCIDELESLKVEIENGH